MTAARAGDIGAAIGWLRTTQAIRSRCRLLFDAALAGKLAHCRLDLAQLDQAVERVVAVTRETYPDLDIPYHSRWRHFTAGGVNRWETLVKSLGSDRREMARVAADLAIVSVLLDAGAGDAWRYSERETGEVYSRSEGLAVASLRMFEQGAFSASGVPCVLDADGLEKLDAAALARGFQVRESNPLVGLEARVSLLQALGRALRQRPDVFGTPPRFGRIVDFLLDRSSGSVSAASVLILLLETLAEIWPFGLRFHDVNVGDVGMHPAARASGLTDGLVPFHKISQWLSYSLLEPLEWAGATLTDLNALTGLPEYRNGGLFVDCGVIRVDRGDLAEPFDPRSTLVVEWRALTVILMDMLAEEVRGRLKMDAEQLPLARLLQGGTWIAGRRIAAERRPSGAPPIRVATDGTTF
jgi:hypothetical protein